MENQKKPKKFTEEEIHQIEKLRKEGLTHRKIAEALERSYSAVKNEIFRHTIDGEYMAQHAIEGRRLGRLNQKRGAKRVPAITTQEINTATDLLKTGSGIKIIRKTLGISYGRALKIISLVLPDLKDDNSDTPKKIEILQQQIDILFDLIREIKNGKN